MNLDFLNLEVVPGVTVKTCFLGVLQTMLKNQSNPHTMLPVLEAPVQAASLEVKPLSEEFQCFEWCNNCPKECKCKSSHWILCPCDTCKAEVVNKELECDNKELEGDNKELEDDKEDSPQKTGKRCHACKEVGHIRANCPISPTLRQCYICKKRGHISIDCPSASIIGETRTCHKCNKKGHVLLNCPDKSSVPIAVIKSSPKKLKLLVRRV
jgi:hypothetical protein